jgi:hypothetical protein
MTWSKVFLSLQHFRGGITCCTAVRLQVCSPIKLAGETKVTELDPTTFIQQDVLQFEVTMHNAFLVQIVYCQTYLAEYVARLLF